ncbi:hypothetical protein ACLOJK_023500 [Asimina triloba]
MNCQRVRVTLASGGRHPDGRPTWIHRPLGGHADAMQMQSSSSSSRSRRTLALKRTSHSPLGLSPSFAALLCSPTKEKMKQESTADEQSLIPRASLPNNGAGGGGGGREDAWSDAATSALIDAWGDRYVQLNRGNLRQKDWKEVADAVNDHQDDGGKPPKTDIQCKNRIDTLKKKYKLEKSKLAPSKWPFFARLDALVGNTAAPASAAAASAAAKTAAAKNPTSVTFTVRPPAKTTLPPSAGGGGPMALAVYSGGSSSKSKLHSRGSTESSHGGNDDNDNDDVAFDGGRRRKHRRREPEAGDDGVLRELARAILKFGEIYERIESSKQQQLMELERQRMEFAKELEFQRMQMFMEAQLEMEKMKRPKYSSGSGEMSFSDTSTVFDQWPQSCMHYALPSVAECVILPPYLILR